MHRRMTTPRGHAELEYLVAASAMAAAAIWFWDGGNYHGFAGGIRGSVESAAATIGGALYDMEP